MSMKLAEAFVTISVDMAGTTQQLGGANAALKQTAQQMDATGRIAKLMAQSAEQAAARQKRSQDEMAASAKRVYDSTRTATERYEAEIARLTRLLKTGAISQDTFNRAVSQSKVHMGAVSAAGGKMGMVLQQASFGAQDFIQVYGQTGVTGALRASANNWAQVLAMINPFAGAIGGLAVAVGTILIPQLLKMGDKTNDLKEELESLREKIDDVRRSARNAIEFSYRITNIGRDAPEMSSKQLQRRSEDLRQDAQATLAEERALAAERDKLASRFLGPLSGIREGSLLEQKLQVEQETGMAIDVPPEVKAEIDRLDKERKDLLNQRAQMLQESRELQKFIPDAQKREQREEQQKESQSLLKEEQQLAQERAEEQKRIAREEEQRRAAAARATMDMLKAVDPKGAELASIRDELAARVRDIMASGMGEASARSAIELAEARAQQAIQREGIQLPSIESFTGEAKSGSRALGFLDEAVERRALTAAQEFDKAGVGVLGVGTLPDRDRRRDRVGFADVAGFQKQIQQSLTMTEAEKAQVKTADNTKATVQKLDQVIQGIDRMNSMPQVATFS